MVYAKYILLTAIVLLSGCNAIVRDVPFLSQAEKDINDIRPDAAEDIPAEDISRLKNIIAGVDQRNLTVEKDPDWIEWSYGEIGVRKLNTVSPDKYSRYAKYVKNGTIYIIVHPAYYVFFNKNAPVIQRETDDKTSGVLDLLIGQISRDAASQFVLQQQINEKNFIEYVSADERLLILILPNDYKKQSNYRYAALKDEYARYINEITNGSESVLSIESKSSTGGDLSTDDIIMLLSFIKKIGAGTIFVGGGYVGRCQMEFYNNMTLFSAGSDYFIVPEISVLSPEDITERTFPDFLNIGRINFQNVTEFIAARTAGKSKIQHLPLWQTSAILDMNTPDRHGIDNFVTLRRGSDSFIGQIDNKTVLRYISSLYSINNRPTSSIVQLPPLQISTTDMNRYNWRGTDNFVTLGKSMNSFIEQVYDNNVLRHICSLYSIDDRPVSPVTH